MESLSSILEGLLQQFGKCAVLSNFVDQTTNFHLKAFFFLHCKTEITNIYVTPEIFGTIFDEFGQLLALGLFTKITMLATRSDSFS